MNVSDFQHEQNRKTMKELEAEGFTFAVSADGYSVSLNGELVGGGSVKLPREKPLHWKHAAENRRDFLQAAIIMAQRSRI